MLVLLPGVGTRDVRFQLSLIIHEWFNLPQVINEHILLLATGGCRNSTSSYAVAVCVPIVDGLIGWADHAHLLVVTYAKDKHLA